MSVTAAMAANNFGFWTVGVLKSIDSGRGWPSRDQYDAAVVYRGAPLEIKAPGLDIRKQIDADAVPDSYFVLQYEHSRRPLHCVIISGLTAPQLISVEQFAREFGVVIIATSREVRSAPFAILPDRDGDIYARSEVYTAYGFKLKPPPFKIIFLDRDPVSPSYQALIRCRPIRKDLDLKAWRSEEICYGNATEKAKEPSDDVSREQAIFDLSVAVILKSTEAFDHRRFEKGWGFASYFPYRDLAMLLAKFGKCDAVDRALRRSKIDKAEKTAILANCPPQPPMKRDSVPGGLAWRGKETGPRQTELLPPLPRLDWSGFLTE